VGGAAGGGAGGGEAEGGSDGLGALGDFPEQATSAMAPRSAAAERQWAGSSNRAVYDKLIRFVSNRVSMREETLKVKRG
jgi:hypothetical protein